MAEHVALLHEGRVLVDGTGALPSCATPSDESTLTAVLALVGADVALAPTTRLPDGRRVHVVGRRGTGPSGRLVRPADLSDPPLAEVVARAVVELDPAHTPAERPDWFRTGWFDRAEAWVDAALAGSDRRRTAPLEPVKMWSLSAVARVVTDGGDLWLKAPCRHFRAEARVHPTVARLFPDLVPTLVAVEETEGWLLMEPLAGADEADRVDGAALEVVRRWAGAQIEAVDRVDDLLAGGCSRRGVEETLTGFDRLLAGSIELPLLSSAELAAVRSCRDQIETLLRELWSAGIPETLSHGDLHLGNVAWDGRSLRIYDWTDGCVSHPFLDASHLTHFEQSRPTGPDLEAAYVEAWRAAYSHVDVDRQLVLARVADLVFQAITFDAIVTSTEAASRWELGGVVADILRSLPDAVARLGQGDTTRKG
jgi:aminoglycoside phosphotransferase (APT) family kinase protein